MRWLVVIVLLGACDTRRSEEPAIRFAVEQLDEHREEADKALAAKADPTVPCVAVKQALEELAVAPQWAQDSARVARRLPHPVLARDADANRGRHRRWRILMRRMMYRLRVKGKAPM